MITTVRKLEYFAVKIEISEKDVRTIECFDTHAEAEHSLKDAHEYALYSIVHYKLDAKEGMVAVERWYYHGTTCTNHFNF